uniref:Uncharacterized protein n=1 Tax=Rhizophora mucronata TaxID=61149 RepID=A0A2P2N2T1_RHIMU
MAMASPITRTSEQSSGVSTFGLLVCLLGRNARISFLKLINIT